MNDEQNKILKKYINKVNLCFPFGYPDKKKIITELKLNLTSFCGDYPEFTYTDLYNIFGSPESYANSLISLSSPAELRTNIRMKKRSIFVIILFVAIIIIVACVSVILIHKL